MVALSLLCLLIYVVYIFPLYFRHADVTVIITEVGELVFSGHTVVKLTVYTNEQLIFPLSVYK